MSLSVLVAHVRATTLELVRYPGYVIPTLLFPSMFFLFFAPDGGPTATVQLCSFAAFAVVGVGLFQFGVAAAVDRTSPWELYLRTLPLAPRTRFAARLVSAGVFAAAAAAAVVVTALVATPASLDTLGYARLASVLVAALVPFALLGIALGYWATPRGAIPLANLLYLVSSYGGGLWIQPGELPGTVRRLSVVLPTRQVADLTGAVAAGARWPSSAWAMLAAWSFVFAVAAVVGYRRDEGQRFR